MKVFLCLVSVFSMLLGCDNSLNNEVDKIVARVGDAYITDKELSYKIEKLTGLTVLASDQNKIRKNVLESLVLSKLMSQKQQLMMSEDEKSNLELEVKAYREERLTQKYLTKQITATPPSAKQVKEFYESNVHRFGGGQYAYVEYWYLRKDCQLKQSLKIKNEKLKKQLLQSGCNESQKVSNDLIVDVANKVGVAPESISSNKAFWFVDKGTQKIAFIQSTERRKAKPLVEVVSSIRKMLAPMQLRSAIAKTKTLLIKEMEIEYFD